MKRIHERVAEVTRVPVENFEYMQLLRYLPCEHVGHPDCQFYRRHHDTIPELATMQPGPRVVRAAGVGTARRDLLAPTPFPTY